MFLGQVVSRTTGLKGIVRAIVLLPLRGPETTMRIVRKPTFSIYQQRQTAVEMPQQRPPAEASLLFLRLGLAWSRPNSTCCR